MRILRPSFILQFLFTFFFLHGTESVGQIQVPLKLINGYGPFNVDKSFLNFIEIPSEHPLFITTSKISYDGIPADIKSVKRAIVWIDFQQFLYQNAELGHLKKDFYVEYCKQHGLKVDAENLSKLPIACFFRIIIGFNKANEEILIIDLDNDGSFSDEQPNKVSIYQSDDDFKKNVGNAAMVSYETMLHGQKEQRVIPFIILKAKDRYVYSFPQYGEGSFKFQGKVEKLAVNNEFRFPNFQYSHVAHNVLGRVELESMAQKGQYLRINNNDFLYLGVDFSNLTLMLKQAEGPVLGSQKGMYAVPFTGRDIRTGDEIKSSNFKGKYLLLDFWGSWCGPCLAQLPELVQNYAQLDTSKVAFLGIAGRDNLKGAKKVITERGILWQNILSDDSNRIVELYNIVAYPTMILISPDGKIVADGFSEITELLAMPELKRDYTLPKK